MTVAEGTRHSSAPDGLAVGAATRACARQAGRPVAYQVAIELNWAWCLTARAAVVHLCPPQGDRARCGAMVPRHARVAVADTIHPPACRRCQAAVGIAFD